MVAEQAAAHAEMSATSEVLSSLTKGNSALSISLASGAGIRCVVAKKRNGRILGMCAVRSSIAAVIRRREPQLPLVVATRVPNAERWWTT